MWYNNISMDYDNQERHASRRVILSEALMVITVIAIVIALAFIVSGYWVNSDFTVERQGMLQISSIPTGASLVVDGETSWLSQTNTSKILKSGEHTISLTKDGYDNWTRTINIRDGLLYRIRYPRLFLQARTPVSVLDTSDITIASFSPDHQTLLLTNSTTNWNLINLTNEKLEPTTIDIAPYFPSTNLAEGATEGTFTGTIENITWDNNNEHALFQVKNNNDAIWTLLDVKNPTNSLTLSQISSLSFDQVMILDNSANTLVALDDDKLYAIDVSRRTVSEPLTSHVEYFNHYGNQIIYVAANTDTSTHLNNNSVDVDTTESSSASHIATPDNVSTSPSKNDSSSRDTSHRYLVALRNPSDDKSRIIKYTDTPVLSVIFQFYDERYLATLSENTLTLYNAGNLTADDLKEDSSYTLSFTPSTIETSISGEYITMSDGCHIAALDMEAEATTEWTAEGSDYDWLSDGMIYSVLDHNLIVYDFDGLNRRLLTTNVSPDFPVTITDDKWLYYFSDSKLMRETIR